MKRRLRLIRNLSFAAIMDLGGVAMANPGNEGVSEVFSFDTRDPVGTVEGESGVFSVFSKNIDGFDVGGSAGFALDTQRSGNGGTLLVLGTVRDTAGVPLAGASVEFRRYGGVFWSGTADEAGIYASAALAEGSYTVVANRAGHAPGIRTVSGSGAWAVDFALEPAPETPPLIDTTREIAPEAVKGPPVVGADLKFFDGGGFGTDPGALDPARPTIVITHGWNPAGVTITESFVPAMAQALLGNHADAQDPNIITWDWMSRADTALPPLAQACEEGVALGKALHDALGSGYVQPIHFIGHSLGAIVNRYACDSLHGDLRDAGDNAFPAWDAEKTMPHATLLDEAAAANFLSKYGWATWTSSAAAWLVADLRSALLAGRVAARLTWKDPIPASAEWIDNYISAVGLYREEAVDVCLLEPSTAMRINHLKDDFIAAHGYAHEWYRETALDPASMNGFWWSRESGADFPPVGWGFGNGDRWYENLDTAARWDLSPNRPDMGFYGWQYDAWASKYDGGFPLIYGLGVSVQEPYGEAFTRLKDSLDGAIDKAGDVVAETVIKAGHHFDAARDAAVDFVSSINPDAVVKDSVTSPVLRFILRTHEATGQNLSDGGIASLDASPEEPGIWIDVAVPADAAFLAFDFTVTGDAAQDRIACAINDQNIFTLAARFAEPGQVTSTDLMDVTAHAGETVELFFGLVGGTSQGCELAIDGIRFQRLAPPRLEISARRQKIRLGWPVTATGWMLESSPDLGPDNWTPYPIDSAVIEDGQGVLEEPLEGPKEFFRLRRVEE